MSKKDLTRGEKVPLNINVSITCKSASRVHAARVGKIFLTPHANFIYFSENEVFTAREVL